jgi:predicted Holliday junction resolvase-like endonuclease
MREALAALVVGAAAGLVLTVVLLRRGVLGEARGRFETWRAAELPRLRSAALDGQRAALKARISAEFDGAFEPLPFPAADVRFLGDPVTFVVFDGLSGGAPAGVVFVGGDAAGVVAECVEAGRVEWATLVMQRSTP